MSDEETRPPKNCRACNGQVPASTKIPCPLCGKLMGFSNNRDIVEGPIEVTDRIRWEGELTETTEIETHYPKRRIVSLIIMIVSVSMVGVFKLELEGYTPFVMLAVFFLSSISFFWKDIIRQRQRVHRTSED